MSVRVFGLILLAILLTACGSDDGGSSNRAEPTRVVLQEGAPVVTVTPIGGEALPTATPTRTPQSALPTWTPTLSPTPTTIPPTATPVVIRPGRLYYIYNGDSIISINPDGTDSRFLATFGVGAQITDLVLSPDESLLAFVAPGSGSAREVYVINRDGTFQQQVSCLGFAVVRNVTWSPDSASVAFFASPDENAVVDVFSANIEGSGNCPGDNRQRRLFATESDSPGDLLWSPDGEALYFSLLGIYRYDLATRTRSEERLTSPAGFGPEFNLLFNPEDPTELAYLTIENPIEGLVTGSPYILDLDAEVSFPNPVGAIQTVTMSWRDQYLIASSAQRISIFNTDRNSLDFDFQSVQTVPYAVYNAGLDVVTFVDVDPQNPAVQQLYTVDMRGRERTQITTHGEGTVSGLVWASEQTE